MNEPQQQHQQQQKQPITKYTYYDNGKKFWQLTYLDGILHGPYKCFDHIHEAVITEGQYENDEPAGKWKHYYVDGALESEGEYIDGLKQGDWITYYKSGAIETISPYVDGDIEGVEKWFYQEDLHEAEPRSESKPSTFGWRQGPLHRTFMHVNDKAHGPFREYFQSGALKVEGNYVERQKRGVWREYHENGNLYSVGEMHGSTRIGLWKFYYEDGSFKRDYDYKN